MKKHSKFLLVAVLSLILASCDILIFEEVIPTGNVTGYVYSATTGFGLNGVLVQVDGHDYSATTGFDGSFTIEVPEGSQVLTFTLEGYIISNLSVFVTEGATTTLTSSSILASEGLSSGELRFVLSWGANPRDLDSHLLLPNGEHVYFGDRQETGANLDIDDTSGYGPETTTITSQLTGNYRYYIYKYSGTGEITESNAKVDIYDSTGLIYSVNVPTFGTGRYWDVASINGGTITINDQIVSSAPTNN